MKTEMGGLSNHGNKGARRNGLMSGSRRQGGKEEAAVDLDSIAAALERSLDLAMTLNLRATAIHIGHAMDSLEQSRADTRHVS